MSEYIPGLGTIRDMTGMADTETGGDGLFYVGRDGVKRILTPADKKVDFIVFQDKTLVFIKSMMGYPAIYPVEEVQFEGPAEAVLMDLDGTSVHSEAFWMLMIEKTIARLAGKPKFQLDPVDEPFVSGHSVSEHLQYCIDKYCPDRMVEEARKIYYEVYETEMDEIMRGRGNPEAFTPAPGLRDFLYELKAHKVKIGLVTSGLYKKAWPEIVSAFRTLDMGDPLDFYDAIITAGTALRKGQTGTIGELAPKPHPWLYAETARVGLGLDPSRKHRIVGLEDSAAGIISVRLANFAPIGIKGGNIEKSGVKSLCFAEYDHLCDALPAILGK